MAKILVVENDADNAEVITLILLAENHEVISLQQTNLLSEVLSSFLPELIIMDILLDNSDGRILCNNIKINSKTRHIPILLITAMLASQAAAVPNLADYLMFKPFDYLAFTKKVYSMIN